MESEIKEITKRIRDELAICYEHIGRKAPESLPIIAASLQEAISFNSQEHVHEIFKRAKDIESIPTQKTLKECYRNYSEEVLKYSGNDDTQAIEYRDPCEAWLPKNVIIKQINLNTAIANYCIACGGKAYYQLCSAVASGKSAHAAFVAPIKAKLRELYTKYWRNIPIANGYPHDAKLNLGLIPPSVDDFRDMFKKEAAGYV